MKTQNMKIHVFDTNIFLTGMDFNLIEGVIYTTPSVIEEIDVERYKEKNRNTLNKIFIAKENRKLMVRVPSNEFLDIVQKNAHRSGDIKALSKTDKEVIALTLELQETFHKQVILYTNDYSMENACMEMGIPFSPLYLKGITSKIYWEVYCPFCNEIHDVSQYNEPCEKCGLRLKRRATNKK